MSSGAVHAAAVVVEAGDLGRTGDEALVHYGVLGGSGRIVSVSGSRCHNKGFTDEWSALVRGHNTSFVFGSILAECPLLGLS